MSQQFEAGGFKSREATGEILSRVVSITPVTIGQSSDQIFGAVGFLDGDVLIGIELTTQVQDTSVVAVPGRISCADAFQVRFLNGSSTNVATPGAGLHTITIYRRGQA